MDTNFDYQSVASLNVNLNRQKYGPLDLSQVFKSQADLDYYRSGGVLSAETATYPQVPYPYAGQVVSLVDNSTGAVTVFKLVPNASTGYFDAVQIDARITPGDLPIAAGQGINFTTADGKTIVNTKLSTGLAFDENDAIYINVMNIFGGTATEVDTPIE